MRFTRYTILAMLMGTMLLAPAPAPAAASKEMLDLQRDVAGVEQQVQDLQKALLDPSTGVITALRTQIQQALETANKTNNNVTSLNTGLMQTMQTSLRGLSDQLNKVTELSVSVGNITSDVSNLQGTVSDLQKTVNRQGQQLSDILNAVKLLQAPAAPPPGVDSGSAAPGASAPPPTGQTLFNHAVGDENGGKPEVALTEYAEFLRLYPNDPNAARAQYYIGNIHYEGGKLTEAVKDFDAVIEQYSSDSATVPTALYMKGMALKQAKKPSEAILSFKAVIKQYPSSVEAGEAQAQLRSMGVAAASAARKPAH